jgi:NAD(P)-dependent dehydrogenase (short-subunit alcohol dehydrogenase family)
MPRHRRRQRHRARHRLAAARAGARLVITDVDPDALAAVGTEIGDSAVAQRALDIADVDAVHAFADETHAAHGVLNAAMNIAGIATWGAVNRLTHEQWRRSLLERLAPPLYAGAMTVANKRFVSELERVGGSGRA